MRGSTIRRSRTNTPLQALVMMNDPVYVEAAQAMARRVIRYGGDSVESRADYAFRLALARPPTKAELKELKSLYASEYNHYASEAEPAADLSGPLPSGMSAPEVAAWTVVANVVMNLDEFLTKR